MPIFATAGALVSAALKAVGIVAEGEVAGGEQSNWALQEFNLLLDEMSIDRNMISARVEETFVLSTAASSYEIRVGGTWNTAPPIKIEDAFLRDTGTDDDFAVDCSMTQQEYNDIPQKDISSRPTRLLYLNTRTSAYVKFNCLPDKAYAAHIFSWKPLSTTVMTLATALAYPNGYESAFFLNLQVKLASAPSYNLPISPKLISDAERAKDRIANMNAEPIRGKIAVPAGMNGSGSNTSKIMGWGY